MPSLDCDCVYQINLEIHNSISLNFIYGKYGLSKDFSLQPIKEQPSSDKTLAALDMFHNWTDVKASSSCGSLSL